MTSNIKAFRPFQPRVVEIPYESVPYAEIAFCGDSEFDCGSIYPNDRRNLSLICDAPLPNPIF